VFHYILTVFKLANILPHTTFRARLARTFKMSSSDGTTKNNINNNSANMPTVQRTFLSSSDPDETVRLECDVYRPPKQQQQREEETKKTKDVFVCLHAHGKLGASRQMLKPHSVMLAKRGFVVYNVSFRGCDGNKSTSNASLVGDVDAKDVLEIVREIREEREKAEDGIVVKINVLGYSFGSAVAASAVGLLHEKFINLENEEEEEKLWSRYGIDALILVGFPLGSLNPFATTVMGFLSRFLLGKHAGRLRKCFSRSTRNRGVVARKTRLFFVHGQRDEFTRSKEVRKFCQKLAKGQPEEEDEEDDEDDEDENKNEKQSSVANHLAEFFFGVDDDENDSGDDDDDDDDDDVERPVESSFETFGNDSNTAPLALLEIKGNKSDHFGFVKIKRQRDLLVKCACKFVL
jgi:pimeloyl-ACP methyl ester carboxylesterase